VLHASLGDNFLQQAATRGAAVRERQGTRVRCQPEQAQHTV
jgi:hypothetical protein